MRARARNLIGAAVGAALMLFPAGAAAAPGNDNFANAEPLTLGATVDGTTVDATLESGEPEHIEDPFPTESHSVWYGWNSGPTPPAHVRVNACGFGGGLLAVYRGASLAGLTRVESRFGCVQTFSPDPETAYRIAVFHVFPPPSAFQLSFRALNPPPNDDFAQAEVLPAALPQVVSGTTADATKEPGEPPAHGGSSGDSVWFAWTPTAPVRAKIEICLPNGAPNPGMAVYTGDAVGALDQVARTNGGFDCTINFDATAETTYRIALTGGSEGPETSFEFTLRQLNPPANDDLSGAQALSSSLPVPVEGTLVDATHEQDEPFHTTSSGPSGPYTPDASVWYEWTAPADGVVVASTCSFTTHSIVAVYTGTTYGGGGDPIQHAAPNNGRCRQRFSASASTTYRIVVDSSSEAPFTLELHAFDPPANDDLADAQPLTAGLPQTVPGSTVDATTEAGEPGHGSDLGAPESSVWFRWSSGEGGQVSVDACRDEPSATLLAVYTGSGYGDLARTVAPNFRCRQRFTALPDTDYLIAVDTGQPAQASFDLTLRRTQPPPNDEASAAQLIEGSDGVSVEGTNVDATHGPDDPEPPDPYLVGSTVWYRWIAPAEPAARTVTVDTCDSDFLSVITVYTGAGPGSLTHHADGERCSEESFPGGDTATFVAVANQTYWIRVGGAGEQDDEGEFTLMLDAGPVTPPAGGGGSATPAPPPATPTKKKCKKGKKLKKGKCVKKRGKKRRK